jgi:hypothetical protein
VTNVLWMIPLVSVPVGFAWGRVGSHYRIPELVQLVIAPLWMGIPGLAVGTVLFASRLVSGGPWAAHFATLGPRSLLELVVSGGVACFGIGAVLGLLIVLGWVCGYRRHPAARRGSAVIRLHPSAVERPFASR